MINLDLPMNFYAWSFQNTSTFPPPLGLGCKKYFPLHCPGEDRNAVREYSLYDIKPDICVVSESVFALRCQAEKKDKRKTISDMCILIQFIYE